MPDYNLKDILRNWYVGNERFGERFGFVGKIVSGDYVVETGDGRVWVTLDDGTALKAINKKVARKPGVKVIVKPNRDGEMEIQGVQSAQTAQSVGNNGAAIANLETPPHQHFIGSGLEDPVESRRFMPGLLHAYSGLTVYIEPFAYDYNGTEMRWPGGTIDLTSKRPATTDYWAWVKVGINPATNAAVATTGTEYALRVSLTLSVLDAINFDTSGYIPCGGVILQEGQTTGPLESDFGEARDFITKFDPARPPAIGGTTPAAGTFTDVTANRYALTAATTLTIATGAVTATKGYHIIAAESGTTDDLDTISGALTRGDLTIQADAGDTITVKHGTGNIFLNGGADFAMSGDMTLRLFYDGTNWSDIGAGGSGSASPWTTNSNVVNLVTDTDTVTIGSATALAKLAVDGDADEVQLLVQGNATQTSLLAVFENSAGTDQVTISGTGGLNVNEAGNDADSHVEGDNDATLTYWDAGNDRVAVGTSAPDSRFLIVGRADEPQLAVKGNATQNQPLVEFRNSASTVLHKVLGTGHIEPGADATYNIGSATAREAQIWGVSVLGNKFVTPVKNTSGSTANANHVGYITYTSGSGAEYKTTTTADLDGVAWCVVIVGGANNADIYVATQGVVTIELNANCSAGDFLFTSTTAGRASVRTTMHYAMFAIALTANAGGAGGTCTARLYTGTTPVSATNSAVVWSVYNHSDSDWVGTINGAPSATSVVYTTSSGSANAMVPGGAGDLGKMLLWNTTRSTGRLITAVNTGTATITTVSSTDAWANTDGITIRSQTTSPAGAAKAVEVDLSQQTAIPILARTVEGLVQKFDSSAAGITTYLHPVETIAASKAFSVWIQVVSKWNADFRSVPLINRRFCVSYGAGGAASALDEFYLGGFKLATP